MSQDSRSKLRLPTARFTLRTLILVVTLLGFWLGWLGHHARQQKAPSEII